MTAKDRAHLLVVQDWYRRVQSFEAHAREAVEAEREVCERLEEACRDAMTAMQEITAHERKAGGARYDYFDDEIEGCHAALDRVRE